MVNWEDPPEKARIEKPDEHRRQTYRDSAQPVRPAAEVMAKMQSAGIDAGVVQTGQDLLEDPQLKFRHHFWNLEHKEIGTLPHLGQSFILSETPAQPRMPAPCLGEHTEHVCREFLGMADSEFVELLSRGAFD